jgi:hypothetical protein
MLLGPAIRKVQSQGPVLEQWLEKFYVALKTR